MNYLTYNEKTNYLLQLIEKGRLTSMKKINEKFETGSKFDPVTIYLCKE